MDQFKFAWLTITLYIKLLFKKQPVKSEYEIRSERLINIITKDFDRLLNYKGSGNYADGNLLRFPYYTPEELVELIENYVPEKGYIDDDESTVNPTYVHRLIKEINKKTNEVLDDKKVPIRGRMTNLVKVWEFYTAELNRYMAAVSDDELEGYNINVELYDPSQKEDPTAPSEDVFPTIII